MRTANNTNNNFSVEKLVNKYCTYVNPSESEIDFFIGAGVYGQLLVTLYSSVAGNEADHQVLSTLSIYAEKYQKDALEEEEFVFLCEHFKDVVSYVFAFNGDILCRDVPYNTIEFVQEMAKPKEGQTIFLTNAEYGDMAALFPGCIVRGFTGSIFRPLPLILEVWAWGQIRLYALGIKSEIVPEIYNEEANNYTYTLPEKGSIDIVITNHRFKDIQQLYELLKEGGSMFWFAEKSKMAGNGYGNSFRKQLVREKSINTLVSFDEEEEREFVLTYIKRRAHKNVRIINDETGKSAVIKAEDLDSDILWPSYYLATRPSTGKPLSSIVKLPSDRRKRLADYVQGGNFLYEDSGVYVRHDVSDFPDLEYIPLVTYHDLGNSYKDANLMEKEVYTVADDVNTNKYNVAEALAFLRLAKQPFIILSEDDKGLRIGYATQVGKNGYAYPLVDCVLYPQKGIDPRYVAALLFLPSVAEQIMTICESEIRMLSLVLDKIIVPDHDEKERLAFLSEANYEALISSKQELRQQHEQFRKSVRMRKHALTQSLSSIKAMIIVLNEYRKRQGGNLSDNEIISRVTGKTVRKAFEFLETNIKEVTTLVDHIADVEYTFGKPERIDPEKFIEEYVSKHENGWLNFKAVITWEKGHNQARLDLKAPDTNETILKKGDSISVLSFPQDALEQVFKNIISNAQSHGFKDNSRKDYQLKFSWHMDGMALIIEIENNGTAIPSDRDASSLLEYGVSSALHKDGHNGIGCHEIDDIMRRYDGKVEIISSPEQEFPVKYVLTFNRSNTVRYFKL